VNEYKPTKILHACNEEETPQVEYTPFNDSDLPKESMFSTPKPDFNPDHAPSLNCLRKCSHWNLAIKMGSKKAVKIP
jgi:hypothetical protein